MRGVKPGRCGLLGRFLPHTGSMVQDPHGLRPHLLSWRSLCYKTFNARKSDHELISYTSVKKYMRTLDCNSHNDD